MAQIRARREAKMELRPSWVDITVDGRKTDIGTGPCAPDGDMVAVFSLRNRGTSERVLTVDCVSDGARVSILVHAGGKLIHVIEREY